MRHARRGAARGGRPVISRARGAGLCLAAALALGAAQAPGAWASPGAATWGYGSSGELGNGSIENRTTFAPVSLLGDVSAVSAGGSFNLALLQDGTVSSWGSDSYGQLGNGSASSRQVPGPVLSLSGVSAVSAGDKDALALLGDGSVRAWGRQPTSLTELQTPQAVEGLAEPVTQVAAGGEDRSVKKAADRGVHNLALMANGTVEAWGNNEHGQLGDGNISNSATPVPVSGLSGVTAIAAGGGQSLALLANGTVMSWGENAFGMLGDGKSGKKYAYSDVPVAVQGVSGAIAVAAGGEDSLALLANGTVMAWGNNNEGELGSAPSVGSAVPAAVAGLGEVTAISAGTGEAGGDKDHNLALLQDGTVRAWGSGAEGDLGDGSKANSSTPVPVTGLSGVSGVSAGSEGSIAAGPPVPVVTAVQPQGGPIGGFTPVTVEGFNLDGATSVLFGSSAALGIEDDLASSLVAIAPSSRPHKVEVTVTTAFGTSGTSGADGYRYAPENTLEFGRCLTVAKGTGLYSSSSCTEAQEGGKFEWTTEIVKKGFSISSKGAVTLEPAKGVSVKCKGATTGGGQYSGPDSLAGISIVFTGCATGSLKSAPQCTSPGAATGELRTAVLSGELGFSNKALDNAALELAPATEGQTFLSFECGSTPMQVSGAVLGALSPVNKASTSLTNSFQSSKGQQHIEAFEGGSPQGLQVSIEGGPLEPFGISGTFLYRNEEKVSINTVI